MKNYLLTTAALLVIVFTSAQAQEKLDTIYANEHKNVALFFSEEISQGITGAEHFVFTYNREKQQHFGLLQAKPGRESNLLVIGTNGSVFSYILKYKKQLSRLNYFIPEAESIGKEKPVVKDSVKDKKPQKNLNKKEGHYRRFCSYLLSKKQRIGRIKKRKNDIILSVENIVFNKEQLYFVIEIENRSSLDYDLNFLNLAIETRKKGKKKSLQRLYQDPVFKYNLPAKIGKKQTVRLVYVMPKFSLSKERRAILELNEKDGERNLKLKISHRFINNPN
ncbi:conjugative transposon protein TraN [Salegentibacter sp. LM13S]|uniref:DUF4138 domain-containing protein n=1 Tax=Salegentibacter lacus TaxID=2873599 RepID=UPI001CCAD912|nr:DUF4138 domain-containing protein [Salegentibacter lacus]MBZ9631571.1 conjugative transposon protein TraN [Salegentibacter lacus]